MRQLRPELDALWTNFWTGGITNPLTVIEQITYLIFLRLLDMQEENRERIARRTGTKVKGSPFEVEQKDGNGQINLVYRKDLRWNQLINMTEEDMHTHMRDAVFPFLRRLGDGENSAGVAKYLRDAQYLIPTGKLLNTAMVALSNLPLNAGDVKGDLYEYLLSKLTTAGINGQFRTPKHIRRLMVTLMEPLPTDIIGDPACGTGGFLVSAMEYLLRTHTSSEARLEHDHSDLIGVAEEDRYTYPGDLLGEHWEHIRKSMFHGFDFDATMLRIAAMNLLLHGVDGDAIHYQDSLASSFKSRFPQYAKESFDLILANPPFKGSLDENTVASELLEEVQSKKTELLFVVRMLDMLKLGGRCAVIVPDGVLFGASRAHVALRSLLLDENQLDGVISLPSGVFKPYAGVSTAILLFTKGGQSKDVFFFDVQNDGYSLDDKRNKIEADDLPALLAAWGNRDPEKLTDRKRQAFFVSADEIRAQKYDLSLNRYKEQEYIAEEYDPPLTILDRMEKLEQEIAADMADLREML